MLSQIGLRPMRIVATDQIGEDELYIGPDPDSVLVEGFVGHMTDAPAWLILCHVSHEVEVRDAISMLQEKQA